MGTARVCFAAVTGRDGRIYAIGGSTVPIGTLGGYVPDAAQTLGSVEVYSVRTNRWTRLASGITPRWALLAVMAPDGKIYAIGGHHSRLVETYTVPTGAGGG